MMQKMAIRRQLSEPQFGSFGPAARFEDLWTPDSTEATSSADGGLEGFDRQVGEEQRFLTPAGRSAFRGVDDGQGRSEGFHLPSGEQHLKLFILDASTASKTLLACFCLEW